MTTFIDYDRDGGYYGAFLATDKVKDDLVWILAEWEVPYLFVKHLAGSKGIHYHILCQLPHIKNVEDWYKFYDKLYSQLRRRRVKKGLLPYSKKDWNGKLYKLRLIQWLQYVKWEEEEMGTPMDLKGWTSEDLLDVWNNIPSEQVTEAKMESEKRKMQYVQEVEREKKAADIEFIHNICVEHHIKQATDLPKLPKRLYYKLLTIPGHEQLCQQILDRITQERVEFERKSMNKQEDWTWRSCALYNMFKNREYDQKERIFIENGDQDYLRPGVELLEMLWNHNNLTKEDLRTIDEVMDAKTNKVNTLCFVGNSDSGKSTVAKVLTQHFVCACIGQAGNASQFIFQDIPNKRIVHHEECIVVPTLVDDYKNIFEGSTRMTVNVKNKRNQMITHRTPVITTSNQLPWSEWCSSSDPIFRNRTRIIDMNVPIMKVHIKGIAKKYPEHIQSNGTIYLNILHYLTFRELIKADDKDKPGVIADMAIMFQRCIMHEYTGKHYECLTNAEFTKVLETKTEAEEELPPPTPEFLDFGSDVIYEDITPPNHPCENCNQFFCFCDSNPIVKSK